MVNTVAKCNSQLMRVTVIINDICIVQDYSATNALRNGTHVS